MKLSEVRGERSLDVIAELIGPIMSIANDESVAKAFSSGSTADAVGKAVPLLLRDHRGDIIAILAAIQGTPPEEYAEGMTIASLLSDVTDIVTDEALLDFLSSFAEEAPAFGAA